MTRNHCDSSKIELKMCDMGRTFVGASSSFYKLYSWWDETLSQEWQSLIKDDQMAAWSPIMTAPRWSRLERLDQGFHLATTSQEIRDQGPATNPLVQLHSKFNIAPSQNPKLTQLFEKPGRNPSSDKIWSNPRHPDPAEKLNGRWVKPATHWAPPCYLCSSLGVTSNTRHGWY